MKLGFSRIGWILVGLLAISAGLISLGESDSRANPTAESYAPSGTAALFQLLDRQGLNPVVERSIRPKLNAGDVVLAFVVPPKGEEKDQPDKILQEQIRKGARAVILPYNGDYQADSEVALRSPTQLTGPNDIHLTLSAAPEIESITNGDVFVREDASGLWQSSNSDLATTSRIGKGLSVVFSNSVFVTNRFIDRVDNAQIIVATLAGLRGPNGRIVFLESTFRGPSEEGFLARIGPWAQSAWWQILVVFGAIIYTENRRFGLPERLRPPQRGLRELFDAIADTQRRSRDIRGALANYLNDTESRVRKALKLPREMSPGERSRILPPDLHLALTKAQLLLVEKDLRSADVLRCVANVEAALNSAIAGSQSLTRL